MSIRFELSSTIPAEAVLVYAAWMDSDQHSAMTGSVAHVTDREGDVFDAWDGYIQGKNIELDPPNRILQTWRTVEFEDEDEDSLLEIEFKPSGGQTIITIKHSNLPDHGMQYKQGWVDNYFTPMKAYFGP